MRPLRVSFSPSYPITNAPHAGEFLPYCHHREAQAGVHVRGWRHVWITFRQWHAALRVSQFPANHRFGMTGVLALPSARTAELHLKASWKAGLRATLWALDTICMFCDWDIE